MQVRTMLLHEPRGQLQVNEREALCWAGAPALNLYSEITGKYCLGLKKKKNTFPNLSNRTSLQIIV